ncbi:MAG TPA: ABC transporter permease [Terriglobia bacterium]|jgi:ABC-type nitrate/sulfonate/bicarbonate transport system permease component|nr:ABC transporter permease [Terriglobia bacterium]HVQ64149.1 ABC transporter permease [Terriglobia bacterium]
MAKRESPYERYEGLILGGTAVIAVLAFWEFIWYKQWVSPLFFSGPSAILKQFWYLLTEGSLPDDILFSGRNFVLGLSAATVTGVVLGVLIGWYRKLRMIFDPFLNALYATPRIAMIPLIIIWFGIDWQSKVFIVYMSSFFPILVNTVAGVRSLDPDLLRAARAFCASDWQIFKTIAIPGSVPFILTGIRQGVALGLIGVVVGEMFGGSKGVGFLVAYGGQTFQTDTVFVGVFLIALSGMLLTFLTERLERRFSRWRPER